MNKTVVITGSSSGIGRAAATLFSAKGWNVAATMRSPDKEEVLGLLPGIKLFRLDITDSQQRKEAFAAIIEAFGRVDVLVNNAGYALLGPFEAATQEQIYRQFDTNVFSLLEFTRLFLPGMRIQRSGALINIASIGGRVSFPLYSLYHGTKWALEGISESLSFELKPFGIRVRIIEPGSIKTDFNSRSQDLADVTEFRAYQEYTQRVTANIDAASSGAVTGTADQVAATIYKAATERGGRLRYPTGGNAPVLLFLRRLLGDRPLMAAARVLFERGTN